ncbi:MAG: alanine dehydrogenase [Deltaproteobacteria bacterium]|nr:alanine dehydrogenase [Deltaproteobacteria bacterium]
MIIGIPKEIKEMEFRISATPNNVRDFVERGHKVFVQRTAGMGAGFPDEAYEEAGATLLETIEEVYERSEMILKVKEPLQAEYPLLREGLILFTYLHLAPNRELTDRLLESKVTGIAYETVERNGHLPLLIPMSEVAGRMSVQEGAKYLEREYGGRGVLLGGVPGVEPANVLVIGDGTVGTNAAKIACGMGAKVCVLGIDLDRLRYLSDVMPKNCVVCMSSPSNIRKYIQAADLVIGAVLVVGEKAPKLVTRDMLKTMKKGAVIVDVAIDQGGCFETSRPTTHSDPVFEVDGVIHYCVANMPGAVPRTSTIALTNATFPYALKIADMGWKNALASDEGFLKGLNVHEGKLTCLSVAKSQGRKSVNPKEIID